MLGNAASDRSYGFLGISGGHHEISHHLNQQDKFDKLKKINHWTIQQFAYFLKLLKESRQVDGNSLLDCTTVVFGCGMSDGNSHSPENLPLLIAGGSGRTVPLGQHLQFPKGTQLASLYLSILRKNHIELERFGNAVQSLPAFGGARI